MRDRHFANVGFLLMLLVALAMLPTAVFVGYTTAEQLDAARSGASPAGDPAVAPGGGERIIARNLATLGVAAALSFGGAWFVGDRYVVRQLRATHEAALRMAQGDFKARVGLGEHPTVVGELARTFDEMAASVERYQAEVRRAEEEIRRLNAQLEERVRQRTHELEAANEELEAFTYTVSHDLRTPLRSVSGFGQVLLEDHADQLDGEGRLIVRRMQAAAEKMAKLIDDLLELGRVTRVELKREDTSLSELARQIAAGLQETAPKRPVEWIIAPGIRAPASPGLVRVALLNLLGNAWKFTRNQGEARIEFGAEEREGETVYFVKDNGAGFDPAHANNLFQPFHRLHPDEEFEGTGIGLATVARIVGRHGGRVWAEAEEGVGARFYFTLGSSDASAWAAWVRVETEASPSVEASPTGGPQPPAALPAATSSKVP